MTTQTEALTIVASLCADGVLDKKEEAILRKALAQPEHEPVAVIGSGFQLLYCRNDWSKGLKVGDCLYTTPPQRTWVGLTDEEINDLVHNHDDFDGLWEFTDAVEAKLKEKNT